jgi:dihydroorotate dehydrogenase electron transfer subunit
MAIHRALRVKRVVPEGQAGVSLMLDGDLPAEPGQFVMVWLPGVEERPFTVMDDAPLSLTIARVGPFTCALCALEPGARLWVRGPYGHGFPLQGRRLLLLGGGSGAAALPLLARRALERGAEVLVALGARTAEQLMLAWRFAELGLAPLIATDDGSAGFHGTVLEAVAEPLQARWPEAVYACGPEPMLRAVARRCQELNLPSWVSLERAMKCGLGVCGNCHWGEKLVCRDGPVFPGALLLEVTPAPEALIP